MSAFLDITQDAIMTAVGDFLTYVVSAGVPVVQGQINRVAEPASPDFVVFWPTMRELIETPANIYSDITLDGSIADDVLTVTGIANGALAVGRTIFGVGITSATAVTAQTSGNPGGIGTYTLSQSWTLGPQAFAAGLQGVYAPMRLTVQMDFHGPNSTDYMQNVIALMRNGLGSLFFVEGGYPVRPLYVDDGNQMPFINGENQYEDRWVLMGRFQANPTTSLPQQFAATLTPTLIDVEAVYPA